MSETPYQIFTYEDPYSLNKTDFWESIAELPHFCASRTLVNGLCSVLGDDIKGLICPLDSFVDHPRVYASWTRNPQLEIQQFSALSSILSGIGAEPDADESVMKSIEKNQHHLLDAVRLFIELDIPASALDPEEATPEQKIFVRVLSETEDDPLFKFPEIPADREALQGIIMDMAENELKEAQNRGTMSQRIVRRCERAVETVDSQQLQSVVVHGVHNFQPAQIRLLTSLETQGVNVIFLFNYQHRYSRIYESWNDIYRCFNVPFQHDSNVPEYRCMNMPSSSNALACAMGDLYQGRSPVGSTSLRRQYRMYRGIEMLEFANITEYAHYVSNHYEAAVLRAAGYSGNVPPSNSSILRSMDEQVYTASHDVSDVLDLYYPEFSRERHFLSYPVGQFFSALYSLWDFSRHEIRFDTSAVKECLSSNFLSAAPGRELLEIFNNIADIFDGVETYTDFRQKIADLYVSRYREVQSAAGSEKAAGLRNLALYSKYKVSEDSLNKLVSAVDEINTIAGDIFGFSGASEGGVDFGHHFKLLIQLVDEKKSGLADEKEKELLESLIERLDEVAPKEGTFSGTFRDLKESLYYYLKQKTDDTQDADWIVKNFEQIDGDILQSRNQSFSRDGRKTYHFACLSDQDMNRSVDDQLPWPLTDEFIRKAYNPVDIKFQIYCTSLEERSSFLRYALFYGLCFNWCDSRLSYVRESGTAVNEPYSLLTILGLKPVTGPVQNSLCTQPPLVSRAGVPVTQIKYDWRQMMDMFLCPYRYFLDYVLCRAPVLQDSFLYQKYFENLLIETVWSRLKGVPRDTARELLRREIVRASSDLSRYFWFFKNTDLIDIQTRAENYLRHRVLGDKGSSAVYYSKGDMDHMAIRKLFGKAMYPASDGSINPYPHFAQLITQPSGRENKRYCSLHAIPMDNSRKAVRTNPGMQALCGDTAEYLNDSAASDRAAVTSEWCTYCPHRGVCLESYSVSRT